jgi:hypothetical protein
MAPATIAEQFALPAMGPVKYSKLAASKFKSLQVSPMVAVSPIESMDYLELPPSSYLCFLTQLLNAKETTST